MKKVLIKDEIIRRNLSLEESEHFIRSFPYSERKDMYADEYMNTRMKTYI